MITVASVVNLGWVRNPFFFFNIDEIKLGNLKINEELVGSHQTIIYESDFKKIRVAIHFGFPSYLNIRIYRNKPFIKSFRFDLFMRNDIFNTSDNKNKTNIAPPDWISKQI